jgi:hypothetical protein
MHETLQEFVDSRGVAVRVDRQQGVIRGVKILGLESRNGRNYLPQALRDAMPLYEGAKVNVNHPKGSPQGPRDYQDRIGVVRQIELRENEGLFGDFYFNPKHQLAEQLAWDAEHAPENVGFSHNVQARLVRQGERNVVEAIVKVQSVDLVADPATTHGLYEQTQPVDLTTVTFEQLQATRPDLVTAAVTEQSALVGQLRHELDQLRTAQLVTQRGQTARRLLQEFGLPQPDGNDAWSQAIVSEAFYAGLLAARDENEMRRLIEDRARLVARAGSSPEGSRCGRGKPTCRDQHTLETLQPTSDSRQFVQAIT